jgi:hypothetical protein
VGFPGLLPASHLKTVLARGSQTACTACQPWLPLQPFLGHENSPPAHAMPNLVVRAEYPREADRATFHPCPLTDSTTCCAISGCTSATRVSPVTAVTPPATPLEPAPCMRGHACATRQPGWVHAQSSKFMTVATRQPPCAHQSYSTDATRTRSGTPYRADIKIPSHEWFHPVSPYTGVPTSSHQLRACEWPLQALQHPQLVFRVTQRAELLLTGSPGQIHQTQQADIALCRTTPGMWTCTHAYPPK